MFNVLNVEVGGEESGRAGEGRIKQANADSSTRELVTVKVTNTAKFALAKHKRQDCGS